MQLLVQAGDLAESLARACGVATVDLASVAGEIIPPVGVNARSAKQLATEKRTGRELQNVRVPLCRVCGVSQPGGVHRVPEDFEDPSVCGDDHHGVALVGIDPEIARVIQGNAIGAFKYGMSNEYIIETQRIVGKCRITVCLTLEGPVTVKFDLPDRPPGRIGNEEVAPVIEG